MTAVLDVRVSDGPDGAQLVAFVDRLAGAGSGGAAVAAARRAVTERVGSGEPPAGLKRLARALHQPAPPRQRRPSDEPETPADVVVEEGLVVMSDATDDELVGTVETLVRRGLRVVVTATRSSTAEAVHRKLPAPLAARVADRPSPLPPADLRRLRRLLATSTPERRVRGRQVLPAPDQLPDADEIAACCERAERPVGGGGSADGVDGEELRRLAELLRSLDADRRDAVTQVGRCVGRTTGALHASPHEHWLVPLASRLVHNTQRAEFEQLQDLAARQREALDQFGGGPSVTEVGPVPATAPDVVRGYLRFLEGGGRSRSRFRSAAQREAEPVLQAFRVDGEVPGTVAALTAVAQHLALRARTAEIEQACHTLDAPVPQDQAQLVELAEALTVAGGATRSVGALRHDVLFLRQGSPVAVPDLATAERVARAIVDYDEQGDPAEAGDELERIAEQLSEPGEPAAAVAPELERLTEALLAHDAGAYAAAAAEVARARRESEDQKECDRLVARLVEAEAELARVWSDPEQGLRDGHGLVCFASTDSLLAELPDPDSADVVVVLGAGSLQADALLLTAVAPRLVAVLGDERRAASSGTTLLEVLNQASARFLRGGAGPAADPVPGPAAAIPVQNAARSDG